MKTPESRDSIPARPEYHNANDAKGNDLYNNFMKMIDAIKEQM